MIELSTNDCKEIIRRQDFKKKDSLWYFFWGVMENDLADTDEAIKKCDEDYKRILVLTARTILDAHTIAQGSLKALIKHSPKKPW